MESDILADPRRAAISNRADQRNVRHAEQTIFSGGLAVTQLISPNSDLLLRCAARSSFPLWQLFRLRFIPHKT
jgi:hypothetical protein